MTPVGNLSRWRLCLADHRDTGCWITASAYSPSTRHFSCIGRSGFVAKPYAEGRYASGAVNGALDPSGLPVLRLDRLLDHLCKPIDRFPRCCLVGIKTLTAKCRRALSAMQISIGCRQIHIASDSSSLGRW